MKRKLGLFLLYNLFGLATYLLFLYLTFPSDVARERLVYEANQSGIRLQLVDLDPAPPFGVKLEGLDIYASEDKGSVRRRATRRPRPDPDGAVPPAVPGGGDVALGNGELSVGEDESSKETSYGEAERPLLSIEQLHISSLLPLLIPGATFGDLTFVAELYGGEAAGSYGQDEEITRVALHASDLDLSHYPIRVDNTEVLLAGFLGIDTELSIHRENIRESSGAFEFKLDKLAVLQGSKVKGIELPSAMAFRDVEGSAEVENGRAEFTEMKLESASMTAIVSGSIMLNRDLSRCRLNLKVALKFGEELQVVNAFLSSSAKSDDDFYHYVISGTLDRLRTRPDRLAARRRDRGTGDSASRNRPDRKRPDRKPFIGDREDPGDRRIIPPPRGFGPVDRMQGKRPPVLDDAERERLREERRRRAEERRKRRQALREQRMKEMRERGVIDSDTIEDLRTRRAPEPVDMADDVDLRYRQFDGPDVEEDMHEDVQDRELDEARDIEDPGDPNSWDEIQR